MIYLVIMVVVAAVGIFRLWLHQRRDHARLHSIEGFRSSLERLSEPTPGSINTSLEETRSRRPSPAQSRHVEAHRSAPRIPNGSTGLDPARRRAAKSRLEARRRAARRAS